MTALRLAFATFLLLVSASCLAAQRTFVAPSGSDSNPCSLTQPCRTFATAIAATDPSGEVLVLDSGGYGGVTINKSVTIAAPPGIYAGISVFPGTDGIDVAASGKKVVLRGLAINGQGGEIGINVAAAAEVHIEHCVVSNMASRGIYITSSGAVFVDHVVVRSNGDSGIEVGPGGADLFVDDTRIASNITGIAITTGHASLNRVAIEDNNLTGILVQPSAAADPRLSVRDSAIAGNGDVGVLIVTASPGASARADFEHTSIVRNTSGGLGVQVSSGSATVDASNINASDNGNDGVGVDGVAGTLTVTSSMIARNARFGMNQTAGGTLRSPGNNIVEGNTLGALQGSITPISPM